MFLTAMLDTEPVVRKFSRKKMFVKVLQKIFFLVNLLTMISKFSKKDSIVCASQ